MRSLECKGASAGAAGGLGWESRSRCSVCKATRPRAARRRLSVWDRVIGAQGSPRSRGGLSRASKQRRAPFPPPRLHKRQLYFGLLLPDLLLFQGSYSSRQVGIAVAVAVGVGAVLALLISVVYCRSKGELLPPRATVPADLASGRWDLKGDDTASPGAQAPGGLRWPEPGVLPGVFWLPLLTGTPSFFSPRLEDLQFACL